MHLVQLLLPAGSQASRVRVMRELTERFGGVTAYSRAPAAGVWKKSARVTERDDIVVFEVMVAKLERRWWGRYRKELEKRLRQKEVVMRALRTERL